jgi:hypothetical protein
MALAANHAALFFSGLALIYLADFTVYLTKYGAKLRKLLKVPFLIITLTSLTPLVVKGIQRQEDVYAIHFGALAPLYFFVLSSSFIFAFLVLLRSYLKSKGRERTRILAVLVSLIVTILFNMITNFVIPVISGSFSLTTIGPLSTIILVLGIFYSIVKHKLFNIRLIVARSLAYILLISALTGMYALVVFGVASSYFEADSNIADKVIPIFTALILAATAPFFRRLFDKLTNSIFYRDAYDPQSFLDELNKTLVGNIEIGILLRHTAAVIETNLKTACYIYVRETEATPARIMGTSQMRIKSDDIKIIKSELSTIRHKTVVAEDLEEHYDELKKVLDEYNIAVV